jgi:hypothetical protein
MCQALGSIPSTTKDKKKKKGEIAHKAFNMQNKTRHHIYSSPISLLFTDNLANGGE